MAVCLSKCLTTGGFIVHLMRCCSVLCVCPGMSKPYHDLQAGGQAPVLGEVERVFIKTQIVDLMVHQPEKVQNQLSEAIAIIGKYDFPHAWDTLIPHMVVQFQSGDFHVINGVLRTAHPLFKKYRYEFRTDELFLEIIHVLNHLAKPLTDLLQATIRYIEVS